RRFTFLPERPLRNFPFFISCIARLTFFDAFLPYLAMTSPNGPEPLETASKERSERSGRRGQGTARALELRGRPVVHEPLQREGRKADGDERAPGDVVAARAREYQAAHPGAHERADLVAEEHDAVERAEVREAEYATENPRHERRHAQPQHAHRRGEDQRRRSADRHNEERDDEER